ncbi:transmembrane protein 253 [Anableps anableps]
MMQNMFQEGLYHVFFKETPPTSPTTPPSNTNNEELTNVRIHRWFGTVVNTRLLVTGVIQVLSALVSILTTVSYACVRYDCSVIMLTPVWSSLSIVILMALNIFSLLFGFAALLANSLASVQPTELSSYRQDPEDMNGLLLEQEDMNL